MTVRTFLDLSTAHLSPAALAWLSEGANLNHAATYHGSGNGAAISTLGATLHGYFMHAPTPPAGEDTLYGMPEELCVIIRHANARGIYYILFDADAETVDGLPVFEDEDSDDEGDDDLPNARHLFDSVAASEGWGIFESNGDVAEQIHLARDDEAGTFETDADAWLHVWAKARAGSAAHKDALNHLQEQSPIRYADLVKFCEDAN